MCSTAALVMENSAMMFTLNVRSTRSLLSSLMSLMLVPCRRRPRRPQPTGRKP